LGTALTLWFVITELSITEYKNISEARADGIYFSKGASLAKNICFWYRAPRL
jgi:hypothetical protein